MTHQVFFVVQPGLSELLPEANMTCRTFAICSVYLNIIYIRCFQHGKVFENVFLGRLLVFLKGRQEFACRRLPKQSDHQTLIDMSHTVATRTALHLTGSDDDVFWTWPRCQLDLPEHNCLLELFKEPENNQTVIWMMLLICLVNRLIIVAKSHQPTGFYRLGLPSRWRWDWSEANSWSDFLRSIWVKKNVWIKNIDLQWSIDIYSL